MAREDGNAFRQFFDLLYPRLYRYAFRYIRSDILCEELLSDVFMKLWNNRKKLPEIDHLDFYLFRSVKNQVLTYIKRSEKEPVELDESFKSSLVEYRTPDNLMIANELADMVEQAVSDLPGRCEMIFRMVREDGLSYKEVAELLDIAPKTVENQMSIAMKKLKTAVEAYYGDQFGQGGNAFEFFLFALLFLPVV